MTSKNILNGGGISRRQFLKHVGVGAAAASMLNSLPLLKALAQGDTEKWTSGAIPHDIKAPFNWTGWEGQGEIEKWQFAFDKPPRHCKLLRMARPLRVPYPGAVYHVKARGNHGQPIFADNPDRERFLETLEEAC